ncbi:MAG: hypothetical protein H7Y12_13600 [Sphingobacteriaceae bacterium]|nr:hypothetical protein [Cytophagaceae bacterium]
MRSQTTFAGSDGKSSYVIGTTYEYEAEGYATRSKSDRVYSYVGDYTDNATNAYQYEYQGGRLVKETDASRYERKYAATGKTELSTGTNVTRYEYDGSGSVSKITTEYISGSNGTSTVTQTFSGGKLTRYTYKAATGQETEPYSLSEGRLIQEKRNDELTTYKYDAAGHPTRIERYIAGKLYSFNEFTYDDQKTATQAEPTRQLKGWPREKWGTTRYGNRDNNQLSERLVYVSATGVQTENGAITSTYFFNAKGLPVKQTRSGKWNSVAYSGENTYGYTDCE